MQRKLIFILFSSLLLMGGVCEMVPTSEPLDERELFGTYVANFDAGLADSLVLNKDYTYARTFVTLENLSIVDIGTWELYTYKSDSNHTNVELKNFKKRYRVKEKGLYEFSNSPASFLDSIPSRLALRIWKFTRGTRTTIRLGSIYDQAWVREYDRDSLPQSQ